MPVNTPASVAEIINELSTSDVPLIRYNIKSISRHAPNIKMKLSR